MKQPASHLQRLLRRARWIWCLSAALRGAVLMAAVLALYLLAVFICDSLFALPSYARWVCLALGGIVGAAAAWRWLLAASPVFASDERVAAYFERRVPELDNALINSVQLGRGDLAGASGELAALYVAGSVGRLDRHSGWEAFDGGRVWQSIKRGALPLAALAACALLFPGSFTGSLARLLNPATTASQVAGLRIEVAPGDAAVPEGGDLAIRATVGEGPVETVVLEYDEPSSPEPVQMAMRPVDGGYEAEMRRIEGPRTYRVAATPAKTGGALSGVLRRIERRPATSRTYRVETVPPPKVEDLRVSYEFPEYTGRPPETDAGEDIKAPVGTKVTIEGTASKDLVSAQLDLGDAQAALTVEGERFSGEFTVNADGVYRLALKDSEGFESVAEVAHGIVAVPDRPPTITITAPDGDVTVAANATVPFVFSIEDDYGLTEAALCAKAGDDADERVVQTFPVEGQTRLDQTASLDLDALGVGAGGLLQVWVRAADNKPEEPQTARSRTVHVRVVGGQSKEEQGEAAKDIVERLQALLQGEKDLRDVLDLPLKQAIGAGKGLSLYADDFRTGAERQTELRDEATAIAKDAVIEDWFVEQIAQGVGRRIVGEMTEAIEGLRALAQRQAEGQDLVAGDVRKTQAVVIDTLETLLGLLGGGEEGVAEEEAQGAEETAEGTEESTSGGPSPKEVEDVLKSFVDEQRKACDRAGQLADKKREDLAPEEKEAFKELAASQDDLAKALEAVVSDLSKVPQQDFTKPTLRDEFIEIMAEVELAEDALRLENKTMAVSVEQMGLELAEQLVHDLPSWLSDVPDKLKWELEEPPAPYDVPMAELPDELTDLMGDLLDEESAMTAEVEDESSSWMDSIDAGAGWATMDGPISNMSAKGKTGNLLPNSSEIGGRSGEGRTGRAHGEFVEKTADGKGGRDTPARLTPDAFEEGQVEDTNTDPVGGATGGGKLSGAGAAGLRGPAPPEVQQAMGRLAGQQADIRNKAEKLQFKLNVMNIPVPGLDRSIGVMKEMEDDLRSFRYENVIEQRDVLLKTMSDSRDALQQHVKVRGERKLYLPKDEQTEILDALDEEIVPEYRDMVADYFRTLAESRR